MRELTDVDHYNALTKLQATLKGLIASKADPARIKNLQTVIKAHQRLHKPPRYYYDCTPKESRK